MSSTSRFAWLEEGLEDDASFDYVVRLSRNTCRGRQQKVKDNVLAYCNDPSFALDRLYLNAEGKPLHIIKNLRDGRQLRLHHETREVLQTYPKEEKGKALRHYRKQACDKVVLIPGDESDLEMVRFALEQHYVHGLGYLRIVKAMNEKGWLSATGKPWSVPSVEYMIHFTIYTGHGISNLWASGKFNIQDREAPREVVYDIGQMMGRKKAKVTVRAPEDWIIKTYPQLFGILRDDLRELIFEKQKEWWAQKHAGQLKRGYQDKHRSSQYFLKKHLRCKETGKGLMGRHSSGDRRYYALSYYQTDTSRPWLRRSVPAEVVEDTTKSLLKEVLTQTDHLRSEVERIVEREAGQRTRANSEITKVEKELSGLDDQITFAIAEISEMGTDAVRKIVEPLKQRRRALQTQMANLSASAAKGKMDVAAVTKTVVAELKNLGSSIDKVSAPLLRSLVTNFTDIQVDMKKWEIDLDVRLPSWAVKKAGQIKDAVVLVSNPEVRVRNENNTENSPILASFNCIFEAAHRKQCLKCTRKAA
jgi:hypothetical protein